MLVDLEQRLAQVLGQRLPAPFMGRVTVIARSPAAGYAAALAVPPGPAAGVRDRGQGGIPLGPTRIGINSGEAVIGTKAACQFWLHLFKIPAFLRLGYDYGPHLPVLACLIAVCMRATGQTQSLT